MRIFTTALTVLVQLAIAPIASGDYKSLDWKLDITLEKEQYLCHEPIWLDVVLTNIRGDTVRFWGFPPPCHAGFNIEITDSAGNRIDYRGPQIEFEFSRSYLLSPSETYFDSFELLYLFGRPASDRFNSLPPGEYYVKASYGEAISNRITLRIVWLSDEEQRELKTSSYSHDMAAQQTFGSVKSLPGETIEFPANSPFSEIAALGYISWAEFLERFPNSGHSRTSLEDHMGNLSFEQKQDFLKSVMVKYKGTRAARHAEQLLKLLGK